MTSWLLETKLYVPPLRASLVPRDRLLERLDAGANTRLSLVSAPAGFGKTTLILHWLRDRGTPVAWLSLDENDNSLARFFSYLCAAIQTVQPGFAASLLASLQTAQAADDAGVAQAFLAELISLDRPLTAVLDDYHLITDPDIHQAVTFILEHLPPGVHFIVTSREDPPFPLPRWRVRGQLVEVRAQDLRFTSPEAARFLRHTMGLDTLAETAVSSLEARTEGWVAGLQLAALTLRGAADPLPVIEQFAGSDRLVTDYLLAEVLHRQPQAIQRFLLTTSILERFNASLCDSLLGSNDSQDLLEIAERSNLFVVPLDNSRYWYRYHHLFKDLLESRLRRERPADEITRLHLAASHWYEAHGLREEAIRHALQAADFDLAADLIAAAELNTIWQQGGANLVQTWARALPVEAIKRYPRAGVLAAGSHMVTGDVVNTLHYFSLVEDEDAVAGEVDFLRSIIIRNEGDNQEALRLAMRALERVDSSQDELLIAINMQITVNLMEMGRIQQAKARLDSLLDQLSGVELNTRLHVFRLQGVLEVQSANLFEARQLCQDAMSLAKASPGAPPPMIGLIYAGLGRLHYEWNELDQAERHCQDALEWGRRTGVTDILFDAYQILMDLACQRADAETAWRFFAEIAPSVRRSRLKTLNHRIDALAASLNCRLGDLDAAVRWANACGFQLADRPDYRHFDIYYTLAFVRLAELRQLDLPGQLPPLLALVDHLVQHSKQAGHAVALIRNLLLKGLILDFQGETALAHAAVDQAMHLSARGTMIRVYLDLGPPMEKLLSSLRGSQPAYLQRLLNEFAREPGRPPQAPTPLGTTPESLTAREYEILQLLAQGLSNSEIQEKLVISKNTVRTHIKNLYAKLSVASRTQAVRRARDLHLL